MDNTPKIVSLYFGLKREDLIGILNLKGEYDEKEFAAAIIPFINIALGLTLVLSREEFTSWLNKPNIQLDNKTPLDIIRNGGVKIIEDLSVDMLSGNPT